LKILNKLRTASLNSGFTGSYKKSSVILNLRQLQCRRILNFKQLVVWISANHCYWISLPFWRADQPLANRYHFSVVWSIATEATHV